MNQKLISNAAKLFGIALVLAASINTSFAQTTSQTKQADAQVVKLGLEGYCPDCIVGMKKWVKGKPEFQSVHDGTTYLFPEASAKAKFDANPAAFVPALDGDCTVCLAKMGKRAPGNIRFASLFKNRVFLFPEQKQKDVFDASPADFADVDLAANGNCIVCLVKMNKQVPGKAEFTAVHQGMRYLFPSDNERQKFIAAPSDFVPARTAKMNGESKTMKHSMLTKVSITGKTGCAACSYGVKPIGAPNELGLAVVDQAGKIFVIEESHTRWPELYKARFDGRKVQVSGEIIRSEGNVTWVKPSKLSIL
jgi:YHS domain-containing protein